jgi:hypothetical protein
LSRDDYAALAADERPARSLLRERVPPASTDVNTLIDIRSLATRPLCDGASARATIRRVLADLEYRYRLLAPSGRPDHTGPSRVAARAPIDGAYLAQDPTALEAALGGLRQSLTGHMTETEGCWWDRAPWFGRSPNSSSLMPSSSAYDSADSIRRHCSRRSRTAPGVARLPLRHRGGALDVSGVDSL